MRIWPSHQYGDLRYVDAACAVGSGPFSTSVVDDDWNEAARGSVSWSPWPSSGSWPPLVRCATTAEAWPLPRPAPSAPMAPYVPAFAPALLLPLCARFRAA